MLRGLFVVKQPTVLDGLAFDPFSFQQDGLTAPEVDVGRGEIVDALVIAPMVVVRDERIDLSFEIAGQIIVLEQDAVLERLMPSLDLALGLGMTWRAAKMLDVPLAEQSDIDAVLLDWRMPPLDGQAVFRLMLQRGYTMPVLVRRQII